MLAHLLPQLPSHIFLFVSRLHRSAAHNTIVQARNFDAQVSLLLLSTRLNLNILYLIREVRSALKDSIGIVVLIEFIREERLVVWC